MVYFFLFLSELDNLDRLDSSFHENVFVSMNLISKMFFDIAMLSIFHFLRQPCLPLNYCCELAIEKLLRRIPFYVFKIGERKEREATSTFTEHLWISRHEGRLISDLDGLSFPSECTCALPFSLWDSHCYILHRGQDVHQIFFHHSLLNCDWNSSCSLWNERCHDQASFSRKRI